MGVREVVTRIPALKASYMTGRPFALPVNITISTSYRCNSRCKTCNVWLLPNDDFTLEEWDRTFESLGHAPYWFTFSGGEPTLRKDLPAMVESAYRHCKPGIINSPTNGIQDKVIPGRIEQILQSCPDSEIIVNLSLDGIGLEHDEIRGVKANFTRAMRTYAAFKDLQTRYKNFTLGIHTVISNFNVDSFPELCEFVQRELKPDSYITEIAEQRVELDTVGLGITPTVEKYSIAIDTLLDSLREQKLAGVSQVTQAFRRHYYEIVKRTLREQRQVIPCMAGIASAQIAPNGDVWTCCIRAEAMGNLRQHDYDFARVWRTAKADALRRSIKAGECHCPLANASYTNMLSHGPTIIKVATDVVRSRKNSLPKGRQPRSKEHLSSAAHAEAAPGTLERPAEEPIQAAAAPVSAQGT